MSFKYFGREWSPLLYSMVCTRSLKSGGFAVKRSLILLKLSGTFKVDELYSEDDCAVSGPSDPELAESFF